MSKIKLLYLTIFIFLFILLSCNSNSLSETINTTDLEITDIVTTETLTDEISLNHGYDLLDISGDTIAGYKVSDSYLVVASYSESEMYFNVYDIISGDMIYDVEESFSDFYVLGLDASDDYLVYIGKDIQSDTYIVKRYSFNEEELLSLTVDNRSDLNTAENPIQIDNDNILVNLSTGYNGKGYTYLIDADSMSSSNLLTSYDINGVIMDGTFEAIYGGANKIIFDQIVMSSFNYIDTYNQVDIYDLNDLSMIRSLDARASEEEVCNILHAQILDSYVGLKSTCTNDINKFVIYNLQNETEVINIEIPYLIDDFKIKDINDDYVLITDGNYQRDNSKVLVYNRSSNEITEISKPNNNLDFFGAISYLVDENILIINSQRLYVYNLETQRYLLIEDNHQIDQVYGMYKGQMIFSGEIENEQYIFSYHIANQEFYLIQEMDTTSFMLNVTNNGISILYDGEDKSFNIYN